MIKAITFFEDLDFELNNMFVRLGVPYSVHFEDEEVILFKDDGGNTLGVSKDSIKDSMFIEEE